MAGIIKVIHCLKEKMVPPNRELKQLNPNINFSDLNLQVVQEALVLKDREKPLLMGVNSFGFGGANAHVILQEYKPKRQESLPVLGHADKLPPIYLAANHQKALAELAASYMDKLEVQGEKFYSLAWNSVFKQSRV